MADPDHLGPLRQRGGEALSAWIDNSPGHRGVKKLVLEDDDDQAGTIAGLLLVSEILLMQLALVTDEPPEAILRRITEAS